MPPDRPSSIHLPPPPRAFSPAETGLSPLQPPTLPFAPSSTTQSRPGSPASSSSRRSSSAEPPAARARSIASIASSAQAAQGESRGDVSLTVNYLPAKYTALHEPGNYAHRRGSFFSRTSLADEASVSDKDNVAPVVNPPPAQTGTGGTRLPRISRFIPSSLNIGGKTIPRGGGRDVFAPDAGRMGGEEEEGDDVLAAGVTADGLRQRRVPQGQGQGQEQEQGVRFSDGAEAVQRAERGKKPKARLVWNRFKWCIFFANLLLLVYAIGILIVALLVWLDVFYRSDVIRVGNRTELIISTTAGALCLFTSLVGFAGIILNNRAFLSVYNLLLWACFALIVTPGYLTYKQHTFNLEGKINAQWSRSLGLSGRLRIQNQLDCCGYFSPFVEATASNTCYARSTLPGCKSRYLKFERGVLKNWYIASFAIVPAHMVIIVTSLLCANHVTYRFGKGLMPKRYRLDESSMAVILDEYAGQIAERYGQDVAREALHRSTSDLQLKEKGRAYSFTYPPSIATSETHDPAVLGVNTLSLRG